MALGTAGAGAQTARPTSMAPPSVAGTWAGVAAAPSGKVELTFALQQDGEHVHGTYDYRGPTFVALNVRVTGAFRAPALTLFEQGAAAPLLDAQVNGRLLAGVYRGLSGPPVPFEAKRID